MDEKYREFLEGKVTTSAGRGIDVDPSECHRSSKPHQRDMTLWALRNGTALIAASYGLGKTHVQIDIARILTSRFPDDKFLIVCPLGVKYQFAMADGPRMGVSIEYVKSDAEIESSKGRILITNYERVRNKNIDPRKHNLIGCTLDEGSVLRSLGNVTSEVFIEVFRDVPFKFVCTATPAPNQYRELIYYSRYLGIMDHGQALAQPLDAKVLTPMGWKSMGDIHLDDVVVAIDGQPTKVIGVYPQGEKVIYRVTFSDGSSTECTAEHLWLTRTQGERANERRYRDRNYRGNDGSRNGKFGTVKSTADIALSLNSAQGAKNHTIPMVAPVEFQAKPVPIDSWLLGLLLGDGFLRDTSVSFATADEWTVNRVSSVIKEFGLFAIHANKPRYDGQPDYSYAISCGKNGGRGPGSNPILSGLRMLGLTGKRAWDKSIPETYLYNTSSIRLSVLQGLMDADGTICKDGTQARLTTVSKQLADDVVFIVRSLGGTATIRERQGRTPKGKEGRTQFRVNIRLPNNINPFSMPRKAHLVKPHNSYPPTRYVVSVEKIGIKQAKCIGVEHPERLYVTDDFIVTHNTRWFKRDPSKAGNLQLHPQHEESFWLWVASWALFIHKPSDLGYDDTGYDLPEIEIVWHRLPTNHINAFELTNNRGQHRLLMETTDGVTERAKEARHTLPARIEKMLEILGQSDYSTHWLIWHHLEDERKAITAAVPECVPVYGSLDLDEKERRIMAIQNGNIRIAALKPQMSGTGCNFQHHCWNVIYLGVNYKFEQFIQSLHRVYRFLQGHKVYIHIVHSESEDNVVEALKAKWERHDELIRKMQAIIQEYGLSSEALKGGLKRTIGVTRQTMEKRGTYKAVNNDCVEEVKTMDDNSVDMILTSIPFGNHYEYTTSLEDFGHNVTNQEFFIQMDFLIPELLRVLKPGRNALIHVKDRIMYGHQTEHGFMGVAPFSDQTVLAFCKHGFIYGGRRTIVTDVVRENNSTYRLGWTEMTKDSTKMNSGLPEYLLWFRKPPTSTDTARADEPVTKSKSEYTRARWQIDAHSFWRSNGNALILAGAPQANDDSALQRAPYDHEAHVARLQAKDERGALPASFFSEPPKSHSEWVWDNVAFMQCLNADQSRRAKVNHICPLPFDIVERAIRLYSNEGEIVFDPFAGLFTVPYMAIKLNREGWGVELNETYYNAGVHYCRLAEMERSAPTLFDYAARIGVDLFATA